MHAFLADRDDHRDNQESIPYIKARYSDCGSFCFLVVGPDDTLDLHSNFLEKMRASIRVPAVWGHTSYNGRFYTVGRRDGPAMVKMYHDFKVPDRGGRDTVNLHNRLLEIIPSEVNITVFPNHLASARMFLLSDKDGDDFVRILFLPDTLFENSGPPEIKFLRVTLNQILAKLDEASRVAEYEADAYSVGDTDEAEAGASEDSQESWSD